MGLKTTVVGSMPKPGYLKIPCWVDATSNKCEINYVQMYNQIKELSPPEELELMTTKAIKEAVDIQNEAGISVITDGEMRRENYIYDFCRRLNGFDFENTAEIIIRNGACRAIAPQIIGEIGPKKYSPHLNVATEWLQVKNMYPDRNIKFTLPGPMTIFDTMKNVYYKDRESFARAFAPFINEAILNLVGKGCKNIQIDEPLMVRYPEEGLRFGIDILNDCFKNVPDDVIKTVHMCCGYPSYLDQDDYEKADPYSYIRLAEAIDESCIDEISLEDTHRRNSNELFEKFKKTTVVLGVVDVVRSRIESVEEIRQHIEEVLKYVPKERLAVAPDCGLIYLPKDIMKLKLKNLVEAAKIVGE